MTRSRFHRRTRTNSATVGVLAALALVLASCGSDESSSEAPTAEDPIEITLYYPIAVGGPLEQVVDGLIEGFEAEHPEIVVEAVYTGDYQDTLVATQTAVDGGDPPTLAVLLAREMYAFLDDDLIEPFDELIENEEDKQWLDRFYPAFMENSRDENGTTWGIPFQRSTAVQYWNKEAFEEAGLDPDTPPNTWDDLVEMAGAVQEGSAVSWGVAIPSGTPWMFESMAIQNGVQLASTDGTEVHFDDPAVIAALERYAALSAEHGVAPPGVVPAGTMPQDFIAGEIGILWASTGQLGSVRDNAPFEFGVAALPQGEQRGASAGGANTYILKAAPDQEKRAALKLVRYLTEPEQAAEWSIATGYVATSPEAWESEEILEYVANFPQAVVARDQLADSGPEFATYQQGRVYELLSNAIQQVMVGDTAAAEAMQGAQQAAEEILQPYRQE